MRELHRESLSALAFVLGVSQERVASYEAGAVRIPPEHIMILASTFNLPLAYFFGGRPDPALH